MKTQAWRPLRTVLLAIVALVVASCGGDDTSITNTGISSNQTPAPTAPPTEVEQVAPTATPRPVDAEPTATPASVALTTGTGSIDEPLVLAGASLTYEDPSSDAVWQLELLGMVETEPASYNSTSGRCLVVLGTISPTAIEDGSISRSYTSPDFGVIVDGELIESDTGACDTDDIQELGYGWLFGTNLTAGTQYAFYSEIFLEGDTPPVPSVVVAGSLPGDEIFYYEPTVLSTLPAPPDEPAVGPLDVELFALQGAALRHTDFTGDAWEGTLFGMVELDTTRSADPGMRCIGLIGVLTPTSIEDGTVSSAYSSPEFSIITDGALQAEVAVGCDTDDVESLGYRPHREADVTLGTAFAFFSYWLVPEQSSPSAVVVGDPTGELALYYRPELITDLIIPESSNGQSVDVDEVSPLGGGTFAFEDFSGDMWEGELAGLVDVPVDRFNDELGRCVALLGTLTAIGLDDGELSSGFSAPQFSVIAEGTLRNPMSGACDTDDLRASGYGAVSNANLTPGTSYPFAVAFFLDEDEAISAVVAGNPTGTDALYFSPDYLNPDSTRAIPEPAPGAVGPLEAEVNGIGAALFGVVDFNDEDAWEVELRGLVEAPSDDDTGVCIILLGVLTPTNISEGTISNPFRTPRFGLLADGLLYSSQTITCDTDEVEEAGYRRILDAEVTVGTSFAFAMPFILPVGSELMAITSGSTADGDATYFEPAILSVIPAG